MYDDQKKSEEDPIYPPPAYSSYSGAQQPPLPYQQPSSPYQQPSSPYNQPPSPYGQQQYQSGYQSGTKETIIIEQPPVIVHVEPCQFTHSPTYCTCPFCHEYVQTKVHYQVGGFAVLICFVIILFGCWLGCCLIPFCVDGCKTALHVCPNCKKQIGEDRII